MEASCQVPTLREETNGMRKGHGTTGLTGFTGKLFVTQE